MYLAKVLAVGMGAIRGRLGIDLSSTHVCSGVPSQARWPGVMAARTVGWPFLQFMHSSATVVGPCWGGSAVDAHVRPMSSRQERPKTLLLHEMSWAVAIPTVDRAKAWRAADEDLVCTVVEL